MDEGVIFSIKNPKEHKISLAYRENKPQTKNIFIGDYKDLSGISLIR
ncbi:6985_t:CDS:1, partial [Dentiscutata erythropus]